MHYIFLAIFIGIMAGIYTKVRNVKDKFNGLGLFAMGVAIILGSIYLCLVMYFNMQEQLNKNWTDVKGTIISINTTSKSKKGAIKSRTIYTINVDCEYLVKNVKYIATLEEKGFREKKKAEKWAAGRKVGDSIALRYDANSPKDHMFSRVSASQQKTMLVVIVIFGLILGSIFLVVGVTFLSPGKERNKDEQQENSKLI